MSICDLRPTTVRLEGMCHNAFHTKTFPLEGMAQKSGSRVSICDFTEAFRLLSCWQPRERELPWSEIMLWATPVGPP